VIGSRHAHYANLLDAIANNIERTNYGAESSPRSPRVMVYVDPKDRERRRQPQTPRPSGNAGQQTSQP
jgi:hypothetical protein